MKDLKRTVVVIIITIQVLPCLITGQSVGAPTMATPSVAPGGAEGGIGSDKTTTGVYNTTSHVTNSRETNTTLEQTRLLDFMTLPIENGSSTLEGTLFPLTNITLQPDLSSTANTKITSDSVENVSPSEQLTDGVIGDSSVTRTSVSQSIRNVHDANLTTVATTGAYVTDHVTNSRETNTTLLQTKRPNVMTLSNENGSSTFESFDFLSRNNLTEPILNSTAKPENSSKNVVMTTPNENVDSTFEYLDFLSLNRSTDPTLNSTANPQFTSENTSVYQMTGNPTDELLRNSSVTGLGEDSHSVIRLHDIHITTVATTGVRNVTNNSDTNTTPDTGLVDVMTLPNENTTLESLSFPFINTTSEPTLNSTANPQNQSKNVSVYQTTEGFITNSSVTTIVDEYHSVSSLHDINNTADATNGAQDKANTTFQSPSFSFKNTSTEPSLDTTANPKYTSVPSENTTSASDKMTVSSTYLQISNSTVTETVLNTVDLYDNNYTTEETATTMPSVTYRSQTDGIVTTLPFTGNPDVGAGQPTAAEDGISTPDQTMAPDTTLAASTMATTMKITTAAPTTQSTTTVPTTTTTTTRMKTTTAKVTTVKPTTAKVTTVKAATVKATTARPRVTSNTTVLTTTTTPAPPYLVQAPPRTANLVPDQIPSEIIVSISTIIVFDKPWHRDLARAWSREYKTFTGAFSATMLTYFESVRNSGFDRLLVDKLSSMTVQVEESSNRRKRQVEEYTAVSYIVQYAYKRLMASGGVDRVLRRTGIPAAVKDRSLNVDGFTPVGSTELIFTSQAEVDKEALKKLVQFDNPCQYYECDRGFSCHQDEVDNTKFSCISRCMVNFCLTKGFCTHLLEGHPTCKCDSTSGGWYTGERCEYFISHVAAVCAAVGVQAVLLACVVFKRRKDSPYLLPVRIAPANSYTRSVHALGKR
ncbi:mucin-5AC-like isoform X2 [Branchiostoma floridae]|uniref:Mucin-5AC-like isoform X2 n=1 Tax=Branchiostoma floridae TaxID=7739 RepID=A0A9J7KJL7_BRAFL|nr:mucin-5AC-like isoform X2 [Branchiostoma floridae]